MSPFLPDRSPSPQSNDANSRSVYDWSWFWRGAANLASIPALILLTAFIGYGGVAREAGLPIGVAAFSVASIWALPSHLVMVAGIGAGTSLVALIFAVILVSVRLMPMTMALVPQIRAPGTRTWHLVLASTFVAVTAWVHTLQRAPELPPRARLPYFVGFAMTLATSCTIVTVITYLVAGTLPALVLAGLYFLTPLYFATSIWRTARGRAELAAVLFGFVLGPVFAIWRPDTNVLLAGLVGGLMAYGLHRWLRKAGAT